MLAGDDDLLAPGPGPGHARVDPLTIAVERERAPLAALHEHHVVGHVLEGSDAGAVDMRRDHVRRVRRYPDQVDPLAAAKLLL